VTNSQNNVHPSYFKNERYQKLYKNVLSGQKDGEIVQEMSHKIQSKRDAHGIPLSNQMLYEKLDFDSDDKQIAAENARDRDPQLLLQESFSELRGSTQARPTDIEDQDSTYPHAGSGKEPKHGNKKSHHLLPT